jgi:hypothetical protein
MRFLWALLALVVLAAPLTGCVAVVHDDHDHHWGPPPDDWHDHR